MTRPSTDLLQARVLHVAGRLGTSGLVGLATLVLSVGALAIGLPLLRQHTHGLELAVASARHQLAEARTLTARGEVSEDPVVALAQQLPSVDEAPAFMGATYQSAAKLGLQIERAEYRWVAAVAGQVQRYQVVLPVRGSFGAMRPWLEEVLHQHPNVALDEFSVRRESEGAASVEARVVLSFYGKGRA